jgi:hypothetical protein
MSEGRNKWLIWKANPGQLLSFWREVTSKFENNFSKSDLSFILEDNESILSLPVK